jgi:hypothetical protein
VIPEEKQGRFLATPPTATMVTKPTANTLQTSDRKYQIVLLRQTCGRNYFVSATGNH